MLSRFGDGPDIFAAMLTLQLKEQKAVKVLQWITKGWFIIFFLGQVIFAVYVVLLYWWSAIQGRFERWNAQTPGLYIEGAYLHNTIFALHIIIAAAVSLLGPLQLLPALRRHMPGFHRASGRVYIFFAFLMGIDGLLLIWRKGAVGDTAMHAIISMNAVIVLICAYSTIKHALKRNLIAHQRWATHLVLGMSGVWLFRVFLMCWLTVNQGPVGFDPDTFRGPFLVILSVTVYVFPQVLVWGYFTALNANVPAVKWIAATLLLYITLGMLTGIFAATMGMWMPLIR